MLFLFAVFYFSPFASSLQFRVGSSRFLEVVDAQGFFRPVCATSAREEFLRIACSLDNSAPLPIATPWPRNRLVTILCIAETQCFTYESPSCQNGILVSCPAAAPSTDPAASYCNKGELLLDGRCFRIGTKVFKNFVLAKDSCPLSVASLPNEESRLALSAAITSLYDPSLTYFTSGFRRGSQWVWQDGSDIELTPEGKGRCLAFRQGKWVGADCGSSGAIICESPLNCLPNDETYEGTKNVTTNGQPCLYWNDPSVLFHGEVVTNQSDWNHNFCRIVGGKPSCFLTPTSLSSCSLEKCNISSLNPRRTVNNCKKDEWQCSDENCIPSEFRCDYEKDCADGSDENNCEDYLRSFELVGAYKVTDKITEIWTNIPHVQGCAKRCSESTLMCECFSFEPSTQTCQISDGTVEMAKVTSKSSSLLYRRRFSPRDVEFSLNEDVLQAVKNGTWRPVCDNNYSTTLLTAICNAAGFGLALYGNGEEEVKQCWEIECLRNANCSTSSTNVPVRCSHCTEAICSDGTCLSRSLLCNGDNDCFDGGDEKACKKPSFRLISGSEMGGNVEVFLAGKWEAVCSEDVDDEIATAICRSNRIGTTGKVLNSVHLSHGGRRISCLEGGCSVGRNVSCPYQAKIQCSAAFLGEMPTCGTRKVQVNARDAAQSRLARVVGGFETRAGAFPWTASLRLKETGIHHCGASILDETHLITAAHCFDEDRRPKSYVVAAGDWDNNVTEGTEQTTFPIRFYFYPLFENLFAHDLAIIEIAQPGFTFTDWVQPICLPTRQFNYEPGTKCTVSGWGSTGLDFPQRMQAASLPIIDRQSCTDASKIYESMSRTSFCAGFLEGGIDSCQGDSGGPYACKDENDRFVLAGVISWGDGCAQRNQPGIYTMVAPYLTWIDEILNKRFNI